MKRASILALLLASGCVFGGGDLAPGDRPDTANADLGRDAGGADDGRADGGANNRPDRCALVDCMDGFQCDPMTGQCIAMCGTSQQICDGDCVSVQSDTTHCGGCGRDCDASPPANAHARSCTDGVCVFECDAGRSDGNGDLNRDESNGCESACASIEPEVCDDIDNDCDGRTDNGLPQFTYYRDQDRDGHGDAFATMTSCLSEAPDGWVTTDGDCDDEARAISPDAPEVCDRVDNDCDTMVDEGFEVLTYHPDMDGDGAGDPTRDADYCVGMQPLGWVTNIDDCDDTRNDRAPGLPELCDNVDNDCNMLIDDGISTTYYVDVDKDTWGVSANSITTCMARPGGYADRAGDCNDSNEDINPGATEVCDGIDNDCNAATNDATNVACRQTIFVTPSGVDGDFNSGGGADGLCAASWGGEPGTWGNWRAIIRDGQMTAAQRIRQVGSIHSPNGTLKWNAGQMWNTPPTGPITEVPPGPIIFDPIMTVWTGTGSNGGANGTNCGGFTTTSGTGSIGSLTSAAQWVNASQNAGCAQLHRLYCIDGQP